MGWNRASMEVKRSLKDGVLDYSGTWDMETHREKIQMKLINLLIN